MSDFTFANVFKILNDAFQLPDGDDVLQSIKNDREQEQEDKETDTNNDNDNISVEIEMANVNNDEIIKKKGSYQSEEVSEDLLTIQQMLDNLIQSVVHEVVNKSVGTKKCRKQCNSAEDRLRREKEKHPILPGCSSVDELKKGCVRKCQDNFSQKRRIKIHRHYCGLSKELQSLCISHVVDTVTPARPRKKTLGRK